jgi:hypothetical protein
MTEMENELKLVKNSVHPEFLVLLMHKIFLHFYYLRVNIHFNQMGEFWYFFYRGVCGKNTS